MEDSLPSAIMVLPVYQFSYSVVFFLKFIFSVVYLDIVVQTKVVKDNYDVMQYRNKLLLQLYIYIYIIIILLYIIKEPLGVIK